MSLHSLLNSPWRLGALELPHRLIQGPLAGYSCAPFRVLFQLFKSPSYCVSEMISAQDILNKHKPSSRYLYRDPQEPRLAYQISGTQKEILAEAAIRLQAQGANVIDMNCGCPKAKIRKKGAGSALLDTPARLIELVSAVRAAITIPLTVKLRIQGTPHDLILAQQLADAGVDALIVHGRRWQDDYDVRCDLQRIASIKRHVNLPVIANGDIRTRADLEQAIEQTGCDAYMIARAGCGQPWLYQSLLEGRVPGIEVMQKVELFMQHVQGLAQLETEHQALRQSRSLLRYYFREHMGAEQCQLLFTAETLQQLRQRLEHVLITA